MHKSELTAEQNELVENVWPAIVLAWNTHRHAFLKGCGRETMEHWVNEAARQHGLYWVWRHKRLTSRRIRRMLDLAVRLGWADVFHSKYTWHDGTVSYNTCHAYRVY